MSNVRQIYRYRVAQRKVKEAEKANRQEAKQDQKYLALLFGAITKFVALAEYFSACLGLRISSFFGRVMIGNRLVTSSGRQKYKNIRVYPCESVSWKKCPVAKQLGD